MMIKRKTEKEMIDKIKWTDSTDEYTVGYWDRIERAIIELPLKEFMESDIPFHRIRTIKKKGTVVWERNQ